MAWFEFVRMALVAKLNLKVLFLMFIFVSFLKLLQLSVILFSLDIANGEKNKNDNIHKNEVQQIRWSDEYCQYTLVANITEYHIISKILNSQISDI